MNCQRDMHHETPSQILSSQVLAGLLLLCSLTPALPVQAAKIACDRSSARPVLIFKEGIEFKDADRSEPNNFFQVFDSCFGNRYVGPIIVDLDSPGGSVDAGLEISRFIARQPRPVTTRISSGNYCISACTYLFVAGKFREIESGGSLEPHGFSAYRGTRIDLALYGILESIKNKKSPDFNDIKVSRLKFLNTGLKRLGQSDPRFDWLSKFFEPVAGPRVTLETVQALIVAFPELTPDQRRMLAKLDSIVEIVITEVERKAAITAFQPHLDKLVGRLEGKDLGMRTGLEEAYWRWMSEHFLVALNAYLTASKSGAPLKNLEIIKADTLREIEGRVLGTMNTVNDALWPYLATRDGDIDLEGFIRLMFSTSILYTRPLTREELCDFNIVNQGCN